MRVCHRNSLRSKTLHGISGVLQRAVPVRVDSLRSKALNGISGVVQCAVPVRVDVHVLSGCFPLSRKSLCSLVWLSSLVDTWLYGTRGLTVRTLGKCILPLDTSCRTRTVVQYPRPHTHPLAWGIVRLSFIPEGSVRNSPTPHVNRNCRRRFCRMSARALMASMGGWKASCRNSLANSLTCKTSSGKTRNSPPRVFPLETAVYPCPWAKNPLEGIHTATLSNPTPCTL